MSPPFALLTRQPATVALNMDEEVANALMALLVGALNWTRNPWARDLYMALQDTGVDTTDEQCDDVRHEVERFIEEEGGSPYVVDEDDDDD